MISRFPLVEILILSGDIQSVKLSEIVRTLDCGWLNIVFGKHSLEML